MDYIFRTGCLLQYNQCRAASWQVTFSGSEYTVSMYFCLNLKLASVV